MKTPAKVALGCLAVGGLFFVLFLAAFFHAAKGFDASKQDPRKLYAHYVQKQIPASVTVHSAVGHVRPMTGGGITFQLKIGQKDLDDLIASKHLHKMEAFPLFTEASAVLKHPEFYGADRDPDWSGADGVRLVVDRDAGIAFYSFFSI